jgi:hypothetical protein
MMTSYTVAETRRYEMEPMTYGEMIASHLDELRHQAAIERNARQLGRDGFIPRWRVATGRLLVSAGERVAGCAELARGEVKPVVKVLG